MQKKTQNWTEKTNHTLTLDASLERAKKQRVGETERNREGEQKKICWQTESKVDQEQIFGKYSCITNTSAHNTTEENKKKSFEKFRFFFLRFTLKIRERQHTPHKATSSTQSKRERAKKTTNQTKSRRKYTRTRLKQTALLRHSLHNVLKRFDVGHKMIKMINIMLLSWKSCMQKKKKRKNQHYKHTHTHARSHFNVVVFINVRN